MWKAPLMVISRSGRMVAIGAAIERYAAFFGGDLRVAESGGDGERALGMLGRRRGAGVRMMGGGPRTFPGGVTKWQWRRMQEKKERQIEKARLLRERRAFEEQRRHEMLAATAKAERPWEQRSLRHPLPPPSAALDPRLRAMADRFRRPDGEDMWNESDGPVSKANGLPSLVFPARRRRDGAKNSPVDGHGAGRAVSERSQWDGPPDSRERAYKSGSRPARLEKDVRERGSARTDAGAGNTHQVAPRTQPRFEDLSVRRKFSPSSSTGSGSGLLENLRDERVGGKTMDRLSGTTGPLQRGRMRSRSDKRIIEAPLKTYVVSTAQESERD